MCAGGCAGAPAALPRDANPPAALPPVPLSTLDGRPARAGDVLAGRPALITLWATWCEACGEEQAALSRLDERVQQRGGLVLAVAVGEPRDTVAEYVARRRLRYAQLVDEEFHFADALGQKRVPATLVVDGDGRVRYVGGALDPGAVEALDRALGHDKRLTSASTR